MEFFLTLTLLLAVLAGVLFWVGRRYFKHKKGTEDPADLPPLPPTYPELLQTHVSYYQSLSDDKKRVFEDRVNQFLQRITIEGVGTEVTDLDRVLVASSAIIPLFGFDNWDYYRLTDVVLYEGNFNQNFETTGRERPYLGMVGEGGVLQSTMVLAKPALHEGFANQTGKSNTGIHEFVHLLDMADGAADGLPESMLDKNHVEPWLRLIHRNINEIKSNHSDINPYGVTSEAEFFAVASEYFFKRPDLLHQKHPDLFARLEAIFHQNPAAPDKEIDEAEADLADEGGADENAKSEVAD